MNSKRAALSLALRKHKDGRQAEALDLCDEILKAAPLNQSAAEIKAMALASLGRHQEAIDFLEAALRRSPKNLATLRNLGGIYGAAGDPTSAVKLLSTALSLEPNDRDTCFNLARAYSESGQGERALPLLRSLVMAPEFREPEEILLGQVLIDLGHCHEAVERLFRLCQLRPNNASAHLLMGMGLLNSLRAIEAIPYLQRATKIQPHFASAFAQLGLANTYLGFKAEGEKCFRIALGIEPERDVFVCHLAQSLLQRGALEEAEELLRSHLQDAQNSSIIWVVLAENLERQNRNEEALLCLSKTGKELPTQATGVLVFARIARRAGKVEEGLRAIEACLAHAKPMEQVLLRHEKGNCLEKMMDYQGAFHAHQQANQSRRIPFDAPAHSQLVDRTITAYARETSQSTNQDPTPVFVIGLPRSGTSLCEQILASHPKVHGAGELEKLRKTLAELAEEKGRLLHNALTSLKPSELDVVACQYITELRENAPWADRIIDKMPHNFLYVGAISQLFQNAKIVHCVRDPMDTLLSCYFQCFHESLSFTTNLETLGLWYQDYHRLMVTWKEKLNHSIYTFRYEDLLENPEREVRALLNAVGLEWHPQCLNFWESDRVVRTASWDQVREPLTNKSAGRWKNYSFALEKLQNKLKELPPL